MAFGTPYLLTGLLLIGIPIAVHLFSLQRSKKINFAYVFLLKEAQKEAKAKSKLKHILLLIARILFITFLVLAFSDPFIPSEQIIETNNQNKVSIYLDNSFSMEQEEHKVNLLEKAKLFAKAIVKSFPQNTQFQVVTNERNVKSRVYNNKEEAIEKIEATQFSSAETPFQWVYRDQIRGINNSSSGNTFLFWLSDYQKSTYSQLDKFSFNPRISTFFVPLGQEIEKSNISIDSVWLETPYLWVQKVNELRLQIINHGKQQIENSLVKLIVEDRQVSTKKLTIEGNTKKTIKLNFSLSSPGIKKCRIEIEDNGLNFDNKFYFTLESAPQIDIAHIYQKRQPYIPGVFADKELFNLSSTSYKAVDFQELLDADLIILENLEKTTQDFQRELLSQLKKGKSIVVFPSDKIDKNLLNQLKINHQKINTDKSFVQLSPPSLGNIFFKDIFEKDPQKAEMPSANIIIETEGYPIIKLKNGKIFLSKTQRGSGLVYLFSSPLDPEFTDLPMHALFLPLMYKMAFQSKNKEERLYYYLNEPVGKTRIDKGSGKSSIYTFSSSEHAIVPAQQQVENELLFTINNQSFHAGHYDVWADSLKPEEKKMAFNYSKRESQINTFSSAELERIAKQNHIQILKSADLESFTSEVKLGFMPRQLWQYFILLALIMVIVEILVTLLWKTRKG